MASEILSGSLRVKVMAFYHFELWKKPANILIERAAFNLSKDCALPYRRNVLRKSDKEG